MGAGRVVPRLKPKNNSTGSKTAAHDLRPFRLFANSLPVHGRVEFLRIDKAVAGKTWREVG